MKYFICAFIPLFSYSVLEKFHDRETILAVLLSDLVLCGIIFLLHKSKKLEFDSQYLYISAGKNIKVVDLTKVVKLKLTMIQINHANLWKLTYQNDQGDYDSVRFLPKWRSMKSFQDQIKKANQGVKIQNWSHSFDFDQ